VYIDIQMVVPVVTAVLIVACPCALSLSYPFTFGNILRAIGRSGLYLKNTRVIEDLDSITDIVFDKTGTLTEGSAQDVGYEGEALTAEQLSLLSFATKSSTHPMSVAIRAYLQNHYTWNDQHEGSFEEIPGLGIQVTHGNHSLKLGSYRFVDVAKKEDETASYVQWNGQVVGRFYVRQHFRSGLRELISGLQTRGYKLHVLTGDNERARKELETLFGPDAEFNFHQSPQMKLAYVKQLEESGRRVLMFGDGLNDAGALQQSTTGIAVSDNVYQFSPACDGILDAAHFQKIPHILTLSQYGRKALRVCFIFSLLYNIVGLSFASTGLLSPLIAAILMPLSSITVVFMSFVLIWRKSRKLGML
jgi:P-type Cu+ transporter